MKKIIFLPVIILAFFYPWVSYSIISVAVLFISFLFYVTTKNSSKIISNYKYDIINYFNELIGNGEFHFNYVKKCSQYFLFPGSSKFFAKILVGSYISLIIIVIIQFFRFENNYLFIGVSVPIIILSMIVSQSYERPILDYQNREKSRIKNTPLFEGVGVYPDFFYDGPWNKIKSN